jgi:hypothetical protein
MNRLFPLPFALLLAALPALACAQRDYREPRVTFYEKADFKGDSLALEPGMFIENLDGTSFGGGRRSNDRISSIRIEGDLEVLVYENSHRRGHVLRLTESVRNLDHRPLPDGLGNWNDRISCIEVRAARDSDRGPGRGRDRDRPRGEDPDIIIRRAFQDVLNREPDPEGLRHYRGLVIDQGWTERMVRDHMRKGDEYRGPVVDKIIKRAYNDILGRDPDPSGLQTYRRALIDRGWTEAQLRDALRGSAEYKNRGKAAPPTTQTPDASAPQPAPDNPTRDRRNRDPEHGDNRPDR